MINIPNALTILRILLVPVFIMLLFRGHGQAALAVFLIAGVTDALDGFIARRFNMCTRLGAVLDPLADKFLVVSAMLFLTLSGRLPWWIAMVVVFRDLLIVGGAVAFFLLTGALEMDPSILSKANTFIQISLILAILVQAAGLTIVSPLLPAFYVIAFLAALISGLHYMFVWSRRAISAVELRNRKLPPRNS